MPDGPDALAELEHRREELYREPGQVGDCRRGSLNAVRRTCGKPGRACVARRHPGHGPQWNLTGTVAGRTRAVHLKPGPDLDKARREVAEYQRFRNLVGQVTDVNEAICEARPAVRQAAAGGAAPGPGWENGGLRAALAQEKAAELGRLAGAAARVLGCGDAGMEAAEAMIRAGQLRLGGSMPGEVLSADHGHRGPRIPCGRGHEAVFAGYRGKVIDTVLGPVTLTRAWSGTGTARGDRVPPRSCAVS